MNDLPATRLLLRLLVNPGWAPLGVVVLHLGLAEFGLTQNFDQHLHFLGGAALAYFVQGLLARLHSNGVTVSGWIQYLLAFTAACTVALLWEFWEFASDRWLGTMLQKSLHDTNLDLVLGSLGAIAALVLIATGRVLFRSRARE